VGRTQERLESAETPRVLEEASTVFADESALFESDPDHSMEEDRFVLLGVAAHALLQRGAQDVLQ